MATTTTRLGRLTAPRMAVSPSAKRRSGPNLSLLRQRGLLCGSSFLETFPDRSKGIFQRLAGDRFHISVNQPAQPEGNITAQTEGFALDNHSSGLFLITPVAVQTPEKSPVASVG